MQATPMISVAAYLENEKVADLKSEYVNGRCLPLVGASRVHDQLCVRLARLIGAHLVGADCRLFRPAVKSHIHIPGDERFYYPDLQVACGELAEQPDYLDSPKLIIEVLSPASEQREREEKIPAYRTIATLEELVLVAYDPPSIELWRRDGGWAAEVATDPATLRLASIGIELTARQIYAGLAFKGK
jgi:Uma2 family endonuclease